MSTAKQSLPNCIDASSIVPEPAHKESTHDPISCYASAF